MSDLAYYAVAQINTTANTINFLEACEQFVTQTKALVEKLNARTAELVALAGEPGDMAISKSPVAPNAKASSARAVPIAQTESQAAPAAAKKKAPAK